MENLDYCEDKIHLHFPKETTLQDVVLSLIDDINQDIIRIVNELGGSPLIIDDDRFIIVKKFLFLSYLIGELNVILATVWRYKEKVACHILSPYVIPVLEDIEDMWKKKDVIVQSGIDLTSCDMKRRIGKFYEFFQLFDSELEMILSEATTIVPYETRLMDILCCSPTSDFKMSVIRPCRSSKYSSVVVTYNLRNLKSIYKGLNEVDHGQSNLREQSKVISYVRDAVRCDNVVYFQRIMNDLSVAECDFQHTYNFYEKSQKFRILSDKYDKILIDLFRSPVYFSSKNEFEGHTFEQVIYSRERISDEPPSLTVNITVPYLNSAYLPLLIQSHNLNLGDVITTRRQDASARDLLKQHNKALKLPSKPEVELTVNFDDGSHRPREVTMKTFYRKNRFCIRELNNSCDIPEIT